jgi:hypothetical protein
MPSSTTRRSRFPSKLSKAAASLFWDEEGKLCRPISGRLGFLSRTGVELLVDGPTLPLRNRLVQIAVGGPPPLQIFTVWVADVFEREPGPSVVKGLIDSPMNPSAFKKFFAELKASV